MSCNFLRFLHYAIRYYFDTFLWLSSETINFKRRLGGGGKSPRFREQAPINATWAPATTRVSDVRLLKTLARESGQCEGEFNAQAPASTPWASSLGVEENSGDA